MLTHQNTTGATSQGHFCTMFLLYQEKEGRGPRGPALQALAVSHTGAGARRRSNRPARAADGLLSFHPIRKKPLIFSDPRPSYNARL